MSLKPVALLAAPSALASLRENYFYFVFLCSVPPACACFFLKRVEQAACSLSEPVEETTLIQAQGSSNAPDALIFILAALAVCFFFLFSLFS